MRKARIAAFGTVFVAGLAASSASQADVIDIAGSLFDPSYTGATLDTSTSFNFSGGVVTEVGADDTTGVALGASIGVSPLPIVYGSGTSATVDVTKSFTAGGLTYEETLTYVKVNRLTPNAITLSFEGEVTSGPGPILGQSADMIITASQAETGTGAIAAEFSEHSPSIVVPEASTWAMMALGFAGLGFAGFRARRTTAAIA